MPRENGFYWVKRRNVRDARWEIAQLVGGEWYTCGDEVYGLAADFEIRDVEIISPDEEPDEPQHEHLKEEKGDDDARS